MINVIAQNDLGCKFAFFYQNEQIVSYDIMTRKLFFSPKSAAYHEQ